MGAGKSASGSAKRIAEEAATAEDAARAAEESAKAEDIAKAEAAKIAEEAAKAEEVARVEASAKAAAAEENAKAEEIAEAEAAKIASGEAMEAPTAHIASTEPTSESPAKSGEKVLQVASQAGFSVGDSVVVDEGTATQEVGTITGFGSILLTQPLQFDHAGGATVAKAPLEVEPPQATDANEAEKTAAAIKLQSMHRGKVDRKLVAEKKQASGQKADPQPPQGAPEEGAAAKKEEPIANAPEQSTVQQHDSTDADKAAAATKLQSIHRGKVDRKKVDEIKQEKKAVEPADKVGAENVASQKPEVPEATEAEKFAAATKVQSIHRGNMDRKQAAEKKQASPDKKNARSSADALPQEPSPQGSIQAAAKVASKQLGKLKDAVAAKVASKQPKQKLKGLSRFFCRGLPVEPPDDVDKDSESKPLLESPSIEDDQPQEHSGASEQVEASGKSSTDDDPPQMPMAAEATEAEKSAVATKMQSIHRGNADRKKTAELKASSPQKAGAQPQEPEAVQDSQLPPPKDELAKLKQLASKELEHPANPVATIPTGMQPQEAEAVQDSQLPPPKD